MAMIYEERALDSVFSQFILRLRGSEEKPPFPLRIAVSMAARAAASGDVCFDLASLQGTVVEHEGLRVTMPSLNTFRALFFDSGVASAPGAFTPLVLDDKSRLYLYRYWKLEHQLAVQLLALASNPPENSISSLFPVEPGGGQEKAVRHALTCRLTVIAGGPGTGKTATVSRILSLLRLQEGGRMKRIALCAPTGKAAARLQSSLREMNERASLADEDAMPLSLAVSTIHRLLGTIQGSTRFRHNPENPLPFDLLVVDEASMIALPLMVALVSALRRDASLILLGDQYQLASVESGAVLGDICSAAAAQPDSPIGESVVTLDKSYRFTTESALGRLSRAVNAGEGPAAVALLADPAVLGITLGPPSGEQAFQKELRECIVAGYRLYLEADSAENSLTLFDRFRILVALREGPGVSGVRGVNRQVERVLQQAGLLLPVEGFYHGRPVLLTSNDYSLNLFNGDTGIVLDDPLHPGEFRVCFMTAEGTLRTVAPERLPSHETAFAMTIHKSQGSEFDHVLMLLPERESPLVTRELLYTGITRAKERLDVRGETALFERAVAKKTIRLSGLADRLLGR